MAKKITTGLEDTIEKAYGSTETEIDRPSLDTGTTESPLFDPVDPERSITPIHEMQPVDEVAPSTGEIFSAAFQLDNSMVSAYRSLSGDRYEPDPDYDMLSDIENTKYESYIDEFIYSDSKAESDAIKRQIDHELELRTTLERADGLGIVAQIAAGVVDPINFVPVGGYAYRASKVAAKGSTFVQGGITGGLSTAAAESILQGTQHTRTWEESALTIGGGVILSGLLGKAASSLGKAEKEKFVVAIEEELGIRAPSESTVGAAQVNSTTLDDEALKGAFGVEKAKWVSPALRLANASSLKVRQIFQKLAEDPFYRNKNAAGIAREASVELRKKKYEGWLADSIHDINLSWKHLKGDMRKAGKPIKGLDKNEFYKDVTKAMRRLDEMDAGPMTKDVDIYWGRVVETAKKLRSGYFEPMFKRAVKVGMLDESQHLPNYVTQIWNQAKIRKNHKQFKELVRGYVDRIVDEEQLASSAEADAIVDDIIRHIESAGHGRMPLPLVPKSGQTKPRKIHIPPDMLEAFEEYLENDIDAVLKAYTRTMSGEIEMRRMFGEKDMKDAFDDIELDYQRLVNESPDNSDALLKEKAQMMEDLQVIRDQILGIGATPHVWTKRMLQLNTARLLGGVVLSSIPDLMRIPMVHGFRRSAGALKDFLKYRSDFVGNANMLREVGVAVDMELSSRFQHMADLFDNDVAPKNWYDRRMEWLMSKFGRVSGLDYWNTGLKRFSGTISLSRMSDEVTKWANGSATKAEIEHLARLGIDQSMAQRIAKQLNDGALEDYDGLKMVLFDAFADDDAMEAMQLAVLREVDEIINTPSIALLPKTIHKSPWVRLIFQFKSFLFASHQQTLIAGLQRGGVSTYMGMAGMVGLGGISHLSKLWLREDMSMGEILDDYEKKPMALLVEAIDQSGLLSLPMELNNTSDKIISRSLQRVTGGSEAKRFANRDKLGALIGPSGDLISKSGTTLDAFFGDKEWSASDTHRLRSLVPFQNVFYLRGIFDEMEEGINEAIGAK